MTNPSAAATSLMSRHPMARHRDGVATRGGPIQADARAPDAAVAAGADALSATHFNLSVLPPSWRRNRSACVPPAHRNNKLVVFADKD